MSILNRTKKVHLLAFCYDLELVFSKNPKIADLIKLITKSENYDEDFAKVWLEVAVSEKSEILEAEREDRKFETKREEKTLEAEREGEREEKK